MKTPRNWPTVIICGIAMLTVATFVCVAGTGIVRLVAYLLGS